MTGRSPWWDRGVHEDRRPLLLARGRIRDAVRRYFMDRGFIEVECGALQVSPGNETHLHAFATERIGPDGTRTLRYLHTSPEFACKKLLADFTDKSLGGLSFWTQPNSWHHFMSDHVVSFSVIPLSAGRTMVRTTWCVHKDAVEGVDYTVENLTAVWNATNDQDRRLVEFSQAGVASSAYAPGPY